MQSQYSLGCSSMTRQRPMLAPGSSARATSVGALSAFSGTQTPSLSVFGGSWCQKPLHSRSPYALASGAKRVTPEDRQSTYSTSSHSCGILGLVVAVEDDVSGFFEDGQAYVVRHFGVAFRFQNKTPAR